MRWTDPHFHFHIYSNSNKSNHGLKGTYLKHFQTPSFLVKLILNLSILFILKCEVLCFFNCDSFDVDYCTKQCHLAAISLLFIVISIHHKNQQLFTYHPQLSLVVFYEALIFCFLLILANKVFGTFLGPKCPQRVLRVLWAS